MRLTPVDLLFVEDLSLAKCTRDNKHSSGVPCLSIAASSSLSMLRLKSLSFSEEASFSLKRKRQEGLTFLKWSWRWNQAIPFLCLKLDYILILCLVYARDQLILKGQQQNIFHMEMVMLATTNCGQEANRLSPSTFCHILIWKLKTNKIFPFTHAVLV